MFNGCTKLTIAPALPATKLESRCYMGMFNGCSSLTEAPELPAAELADLCYYYMFTNCTKLNYIKCLATSIPASSSALYLWTEGVASTGTFVKAAAMNDWPTGTSGIPEGWTVVNEGDTPSGGNEGTGEEPWN